MAILQLIKMCVGTKGKDWWVKWIQGCIGLGCEVRFWLCSLLPSIGGGGKAIPVSLHSSDTKLFFLSDFDDASVIMLHKLPMLVAMDTDCFYVSKAFFKN